MIKKIKEFNSNNYQIYLFISLIFILIVLSFNSFNKKESVKTCLIPSQNLSYDENFSYNIEIDENAINAKVKKYNNKYLIEIINGDITETYYVYYTDFYKKNDDNTYSKYDGSNIIGSLDNKYLFLDYLNDLSYGKKAYSNSNGYCYNIKNFKLCLNDDKTVNLEVNDMKVKYYVTETGSNTDFEIEIKGVNENEE